MESEGTEAREPDGIDAVGCGESDATGDEAGFLKL
jgi:hypothetical protein